MIRAFVLLASLTLPSIAVAQEAVADAPPTRIRNINLLPGEKCPAPSSPDEVVVCGTVDEQFRIPKQFRDIPKQTAESTAWGVKADRAMEDNRKVLPGSCTPIGTAGQSGCAMKSAEQWAAERRAAANGYTRPE